MSSTVPAWFAVLARCAAAVVVVVASACEVVGSIGGIDDLAAGGSDSASSTGGTQKLPNGPERPRDTDDALATSSAGEGMPPDGSDSSSGSDSADLPAKLDLGGGTSGEGDTETVGTLGAACCIASLEPGCADDSELEACVCGFDAYCCEAAWDDTCVGIATWGECGGGCEPELPPGDCCIAGDVASCVDRQIATCVCDHDPYCCDVAWDDVCVGDVAQHDCGLCP